MKFPLGAMTVGDILDRGLRLLLARFPTFLLINLLVQLPVLLVQLVGTPWLYERITQGNLQNLLQTLLVAGLGIVVLSIVLLWIGIAATLHVVAQEYIDRSAGVGEAFGVAFRRFGALAGTVILAFLIVLVVLVGCMAPGFATQSVGLLLLGILACLVFCILFVVWFAFVSQVVVMEGISGAAALARSKELGSGYGGRIFGTIILLGMIQWGLGLGATLIRQVFPYMEMVPGPGNVQIPKFVDYTNFYICSVVEFLVGVIAHSYQAVCVTLLYIDLRIRKEGFDLEVAARQQAGGELPALQGPGEAGPDVPGRDQW